MRFKVKTSEIVEQFETTSKASAASPLIPILANTKLVAGKDSITAITSKLDLTSIVTIPAVVEEQGEICVPTKTFIKVIKNLPKDNDMEIEFAKSTMKVYSGEYEYSLLCKSTEDFPVIEDIKGDKIKISDEDKRILATGIKRAALIAGSEKYPYLFLQRDKYNNKEIAVSGCDTSRVVYTRTHIKTFFENNIPITVEAAKLLVSMLQADSEAVEIATNENRLAFYSGNQSIYIQLPESNFPNLDDLLPGKLDIITDNNIPCRAKFNYNQLFTTLKMTEPIASDGRPVIGIFIGVDKAIFVADDAYIGKVELFIPVEHNLYQKHKDDFYILTVYKFLADLAAFGTSENVFLLFANTKGKAANTEIITAALDGDNDMVYIIAPVNVETFSTTMVKELIEKVKR